MENLFFINWFLIWLTGERIGSVGSRPTLHASQSRHRSACAENQRATGSVEKIQISER